MLYGNCLDVTKGIIYDAYKDVEGWITLASIENLLQQDVNLMN